MSTKIYNAFEYKGTIQELMNDLKEMREGYRKQVVTMLVNSPATCEILKCTAKKLYCDFLRRYNYSDDFDLENDPVKDIEVRHLNYSEMLYFLELMCKSQINDPLNIEASSVIYINNNKIYVQFFGYKLNTRKYKKFSDYHYQNQVDKPKGITNKQWDEREKVWDDIFKDRNLPSAAGMCYDFGNDIIDICLKVSDNVHKLSKKEVKVNE